MARRRTTMRVEVVSRRHLHFDDGTPVRAASGLARLGDGWLVAQDDAVDAAWLRPDTTTRVRVLPPVEGHVVFGPAAGTKHLKPDLESACHVTTSTGDAVLLLGSGSLPGRMSGVVVRPSSAVAQVVSADLCGLYARVAEALGVPLDQINLEGACQVGGAARWFQRGSSALALTDASVDVDLGALLDAVEGRRSHDAVPVREVRRHALGDVDGIGLAATDAVALPDGRVLLSAAAEDTPNAVDDGPVVGSALVLLDGSEVRGAVELPPVDGAPAKVEGLAVVAAHRDRLHLLAVVDEDREGAPSALLELTVRGL